MQAFMVPDLQTRRKNRAVLILLILLAILFYWVTLHRMGYGG